MILCITLCISICNETWISRVFSLWNCKFLPCRVRFLSLVYYVLLTLWIFSIMLAKHVVCSNLCLSFRIISPLKPIHTVFFDADLWTITMNNAENSWRLPIHISRILFQSSWSIANSYFRLHFNSWGRWCRRCNHAVTLFQYCLMLLIKFLFPKCT